jgi:hypothetical protein
MTQDNDVGVFQIKFIGAERRKKLQYLEMRNGDGYCVDGWHLN